MTADMTLGEFEAHVSGLHRDLRSQTGTVGEITRGGITLGEMKMAGLAKDQSESHCL